MEKRSDISGWSLALYSHRNQGIRGYAARSHRSEAQVPEPSYCPQYIALGWDAALLHALGETGCAIANLCKQRQVPRGINRGAAKWVLVANWGIQPGRHASTPKTTRYSYLHHDQTQIMSLSILRRSTEVLHAKVRRRKIMNRLWGTSGRYPR